VGHFPPLDFGYPQFLPEHIMIHAGIPIIERASPTAHIKGDMFFQSGFLTDFLQQIFQPAW